MSSWQSQTVKENEFFLIFTALLISSFHVPIIHPPASCIKKNEEKQPRLIIHLIKKQKSHFFHKDLLEDEERIF